VKGKNFYRKGAKVFYSLECEEFGEVAMKKREKSLYFSLP